VKGTSKARPHESIKRVVFLTSISWCSYVDTRDFRIVICIPRCRKGQPHDPPARSGKWCCSSFASPGTTPTTLSPPGPRLGTSSQLGWHWVTLATSWSAVGHGLMLGQSAPTCIPDAKPQATSPSPSHPALSLRWSLEPLWASPHGQPLAVQGEPPWFPLRPPR
jgi:hypothetical protein